MPPAADGQGVVRRLLPEIEKAFRTIPESGEVSIRVMFRDSEPVRIEYGGAIILPLRPRSDRGGR